MESKKQGKTNEIRQQSSELENHVIDEYVSGRISRRDFVRRGSLIGIGIPVLASIVGTETSAAATSKSSSFSPPAGSIRYSAATNRKAGGILSVAVVPPNERVDPTLAADIGAACMLNQTSEPLVFNDPHLNLSPMLATKWSPNSDASVWTFNLRQGVKFQNGKVMTADDVIYTYNLGTNPKVASNASSALSGVLSYGQTEKIDDYTVAFHLDTPVGNFPYIVSSDLYNTYIIPNGYNPEDWQSTFIGTGPFKLKKFTTDVGAEFSRYTDYWGSKAILDGTSFTFYETPEAQIVALTGNTVDAMDQISVQGGEAVLDNSSYHVLNYPTSAYREIHMRCDRPPFNDKRVRQALALTLDRPAIITALFGGKAILGNDSPFASIYKSNDPSVPQRTKNLDKARQLMKDAGQEKGFSVTLYAENLGEIPDLAQIMKQSASQIGITLNLVVQSSAQFYGDAVFGKSNWLDSDIGIVDYGARGVPNTELLATLETNAVWNAAHFSNSTYNALVKQYLGELDIQKQKKIAGQIEALLLDETPVIIPYFYNWLTPTQKDVRGVVPGFLGQIWLGDSYFAS